MIAPPLCNLMVGVRYCAFRFLRSSRLHGIHETKTFLAWKLNPQITKLHAALTCKLGNFIKIFRLISQKAPLLRTFITYFEIIAARFSHIVDLFCVLIRCRSLQNENNNLDAKHHILSPRFQTQFFNVSRYVPFLTHFTFGEVLVFVKYQISPYVICSQNCLNLRNDGLTFY